MNANEIMACESRKIEKWSRFQLSNNWKMRGIIITLSIIIILAILKISGFEVESWVKDIIKRALLVSLLVVSLSKDREEDEMIVSVRSKSYAVAFIFAVLYCLVQPLVDTIISDYVFNSTVKNSFSYFQALFFMLMIQIMFFEVLKRNR